jgi:hypothetical protein
MNTLQLEKRLKDRRVKKILVLDVETLGVGGEGKHPPLIFDIGFILTDKQGNKFRKGSYLIKEVFLNMDLMKKAHYYNKYPDYLEGLERGNFKLKSWCEIMEELEEILSLYNVSQVSAYNLGFDLRALNYTSKRLNNGYEFNLFEGLELQDIWDMAVDTLGQQKTYQNQFHWRNKFTDSGKFLKSNAESMWQYCIQQWNFVEAHTGLADCEIEVQIMARCYKNNKPFKKGYNNNPYRRMKRNPNLPTSVEFL